MNLSEVIYEAACRIKPGQMSCIAIEDVKGGTSARYSKLMAATGDVCQSCAADREACCIEVDAAARRLKWTKRDFRTFMLLMASEALK